MTPWQWLLIGVALIATSTLFDIGSTNRFVVKFGAAIYWFRVVIFFRTDITYHDAWLQYIALFLFFYCVITAPTEMFGAAGRKYRKGG